MHRPKEIKQNKKNDSTKTNNNEDKCTKDVEKKR
jgi:hypothetical protein